MGISPTSDAKVVGSNNGRVPVGRKNYVYVLRALNSEGKHGVESGMA